VKTFVAALTVGSPQYDCRGIGQIQMCTDPYAACEGTARSHLPHSRGLSLPDDATRWPLAKQSQHPILAVSEDDIDCVTDPKAVNGTAVGQAQHIEPLPCGPTTDAQRSIQETLCQMDTPSRHPTVDAQHLHTVHRGCHVLNTLAESA
jgi:hypothetical protein